jgi:hypothetical protein
MKHSKVFTLISQLPTKDKKPVSEALKQNKRKTLALLYHGLDKAVSAGEEEPGADNIYKMVFGVKYEKAKDYLLRNEYRLLYAELTTILLDGEKEKETDLKWLQYLLQKGIYEVLEDDLADAWRKAEQTDDLKQLTAICDLKINYLLNARIQAQGTARELAELSQKRIAWLQQLALRNIRQEEIRLKLAERLLRVYQQDHTPVEPLANIDLLGFEATDAYARYLSRRALINSARSDEKIALLLEILADKAIIKKYEPESEEAMCRFLINLAQEYYLMGQFVESVQYYSKAMEYIANVAKSVKETLVYNYILALMRIADHSKARDLAEEHSQLILNSKLTGGRGPFLFAVLHIYARDTESAEKYIQLEVKKDGSEFIHFMRLALAAVYYLRNDLDFALRECVNVDQAVNYELNRDATLQTHISKPIIANFRRFYTLLQSRPPKEEFIHSMSKLTTDVRAQHAGQVSDQSPDSVLTQWMLMEAERLLLA